MCQPCTQAVEWLESSLLLYLWQEEAGFFPFAFFLFDFSKEKSQFIRGQWRLWKEGGRSADRREALCRRWKKEVGRERSGKEEGAQAATCPCQHQAGLEPLPVCRISQLPALSSLQEPWAMVVAWDSFYFPLNKPLLILFYTSFFSSFLNYYWKCRAWSSIHWFTPKNANSTWTGPHDTQKPGPHSGSPHCLL